MNTDNKLHTLLLAAALALPMMAVAAGDEDTVAVAASAEAYGGGVYGSGNAANSDNADVPPAGAEGGMPMPGHQRGPRFGDEGRLPMMDGGRPHGAPLYGPHPGGPGMAPGMAGMPGMDAMLPPPLPPFLHGIELSEAQQDKVFAIVHGQIPYLREQGKTLHKSHEALAALARAEKYDDAKAASLAQSAAQAMANLELSRVRTDQKLLAVLTAEQRKQVEQRMAAMPRPAHRS